MVKNGQIEFFEINAVEEEETLSPKTILIGNQIR